MPLKEIDTFHAMTCRYHTLTTLLNKKLILHKKKNQFNYHASKNQVKGLYLLQCKGEDKFYLYEEKEKCKNTLSQQLYF